MKTMDIHGKVTDAEPGHLKNELLFIMDSVGWQEFVKANTPNCNKIGKTRKAFSSSYYTPPSILAMMRGNVPQPLSEGCFWPYGEYSNVGEHAFIPIKLGNLGYHTYLISNNILIDDTHFVDKDCVAHTDYFKNYIVDWEDPLSSRKLIKQFLGQVKEPFYAFFLFVETHTPYLNTKGKMRRSNEGQIKAIEHLDTSFGMLRNGLRSKKLTHETRVIISADHSESWDKHNQDHKGHNPTRLTEYVRDGSMRRLQTVPLIFGSL